MLGAPSCIRKESLTRKGEKKGRKEKQLKGRGRKSFETQQKQRERSLRIIGEKGEKRVSFKARLSPLGTRAHITAA